MNKTVIILRGAPGSGKSTWVENYFGYDCDESVLCESVSADTYRYDNFGDYIYKPEDNKKCHDLCFKEFCTLVSLQYDLLCVDNTNIKKNEYQRYVKYAQEHSYQVYQKVFTGDYSNIHGVPDDVIQRMRDTFEHDSVLPLFFPDIKKE